MKNANLPKYSWLIYSDCINGVKVLLIDGKIEFMVCTVRIFTLQGILRIYSIFWYS